MDNITEPLSPEAPQEQKASRSYIWIIILSVILSIIAIVGYGIYSLVSVSEKSAISAISEFSNIAKVVANTPPRPGITEMALAGDSPSASSTRKVSPNPITDTGAQETIEAMYRLRYACDIAGAYSYYTTKAKWQELDYDSKFNDMSEADIDALITVEHTEQTASHTGDTLTALLDISQQMAQPWVEEKQREIQQRITYRKEDCYRGTGEFTPKTYTIDSVVYARDNSGAADVVVSEGSGYKKLYSMRYSSTTGSWHIYDTEDLVVPVQSDEEIWGPKKM